MPPHSARLTAFEAITILGLALVPLAGPAAVAGSAAAREAVLLSGADAADDATALALARERSARADAAVDALKQSASPAHFADPMPDGRGLASLDALRADYADMQRKAAGYRATLGDQHPTMVAAEQVLAHLRAEILDANRKALAAAERAAADARNEAATAERRFAARIAAARADDVTGSVAGRPAAADDVKPPPELRLAERGRPADPVALAAGSAEPTAGPPVRHERPTATSLGRRLLGAAIGVLALLMSAWAMRQLLHRRRRVARPAMRRIEPDLMVHDATPSAVILLPPDPMPVTLLVEHVPTEVAQADRVPVVAEFPLAADVAAAFAVPAGRTSPEGASEPPVSVRVAGEIHATLRAAFGPRGRMAVLLAPVDGLPSRDADGVAIALALAAAAAGRRPLLMEARPAGRLRASLVPAGTAPAVVEAGGTIRTLYWVEIAGLTVGILPSDAGEAEAALAAETRPGTGRIHGLSGFNTVVVLGDGDEAEVLARGADLTLLMAPAGATQTDLAMAAEPLRAGGRPYAALLVERDAARPAVPGSPARGAPAPRRRPAGDTAARLGLRGSFEPARARRGA